VQVISGAGEFELSVDRVEVRNGSVVLIGKMGVWESETIIDEADLGRLLRASLSLRVAGWAASRPFVALWRRLGGRRGRVQ
jgi:hypothetical protein